MTSCTSLAMSQPNIAKRRIAMRGNVDIADPLAVRVVEAALRSFMPEAVLVLDDPARTQRYLALCAVHAPSARAIAYLPVDGLIRNPSQFRAIAERALIVASTQCVAENIEGALGDLSHRLAPTIVPPADFPGGIPRKSRQMATACWHGARLYIAICLFQAAPCLRGDLSS